LHGSEIDAGSGGASNLHRGLGSMLRAPARPWRGRRVAVELAGAAAPGSEAAAPGSRLRHIDGLRAIAIIAVAAFHAHIPGFRGGFVGVDIFFVISGFLITQQIVSQMLAGSFSAADFYARRVLRIFPPLLMVTVVTLAVAPLFPLLPQERGELATSGAATAVMISNYHFTSGTEYFSEHTEIEPLLHTWSLGVEEQYYLFAPLLLAAVIALAAWRKWRPLPTLVGFGMLGILASYIALAILTKTDHRLAFFSVMTRGWQFALGGMLAVAVLQGTLLPQRLRSALGIIGLAAVAAAILLYNEHISYPGLAAALPPTVGALLLLASGIGNDSAPLTRILASRPAVALGLLSYSWYLWHWPLTELARTLAIGQDSIWKDVAASLAALALSVPTYLFLERPLKALRRPEITGRFGGRIVAGGLAGSAVIAVAALILAPGAASDRERQAIEGEGPSRAVTGCGSRTSVPKLAWIIPCVTGAAADPSVVFWGDSHALMLKPVAEWSALDEGRSSVVLSKVSCPPLLGIEVDIFVRRSCAESNDEILAWIRGRQAHPIIGVVLAARWLLYNNEETLAGDAELTRMLWRDADRSESDYLGMLEGSLGELLTALSPSRRLLVIGPTPELKRPVANCLWRAQMNGQPRDSCALDRSDVESRRQAAAEVLRRVVVKLPNARVIDPLEAFCDRDKCWPFGLQGVFYFDDNHLSVLGNERLYQHFQRDFQWVYGAGAGETPR
jgi:peptidoglycan/LPS O-acetylase OafA/YrhL